MQRVKSPGNTWGTIQQVSRNQTGSRDARTGWAKRNHRQKERLVGAVVSRYRTRERTSPKGPAGTAPGLDCGVSTQTLQGQRSKGRAECDRQQRIRVSCRAEQARTWKQRQLSGAFT